MAERKRAKLFRNGGSQAVRLPAGFQFDGDEVLISRDEETGDVILSPQSGAGNTSWREFFADLDATEVPEEDVDEYVRTMEQIVADRSNHPISSRGIFDDVLDEDDRT